MQNVSDVLDVPETGVRCPVGDAGCGSVGPIGGWARNQAECVATTRESDLRYVRAR